MLGKIALAAVADTKGPVNEALQLALGNGLGYAAYLLQRQLPFQYEPREAQRSEIHGLRGIAHSTLGGGVQWDAAAGQGQPGHILHDQGIHSGFLQLPQQL